MEDLKIKTEFHPVYKDIVIIQLAGYIDQTNSGQIERIIIDILKSGKNKFVFDFRELIYMSSAGWGVFVGEIKMVRERGGDIKIAAMSPEVYEVFQMLEFYHIIQEFATVDEAVESFPDGTYRPKQVVKAESPETNGIDELLIQSGLKSSIIAEEKEKIIITDFEATSNTPTPAAVREKREIPIPARHKQPIPRVPSGLEESTIDIARLPVTEKIKKVVANYPLLNILQIKKMLQHEKFGYTKIGLLKLYRILKELNLHNRTTRYRYYRSV
jgi:anti-sigma B factor antagonist